MNDIDKIPSKCRDCAYWGLATFPWCCGDCKDRLKKPVSDFVSRQWLIDEYHRRHEGPPGEAFKMIEEAPAVDVVQIVNCQDCKFLERCFRNLKFINEDGSTSTGVLRWCSIGRKKDRFR